MTLKRSTFIALLAVLSAPIPIGSAMSSAVTTEPTRLSIPQVPVVLVLPTEPPPPIKSMTEREAEEEQYVLSLVPKRCREIFRANADRYEIPYTILYRLILRESAFDARAKNYNKTSYDVSYMQLNSKNFAEFNWRYFDGYPKVKFDPWKAEHNFQVGCEYLSTLARYYGSWRSAVAAYNCGPGRFDRGDIPESTLDYVAFVFDDTWEGYSYTRRYYE